MTPTAGALARFFIRRPIASGMLAAALLLLGLLGWRLLPVAPLPEIDYPTIVVRADLPGASPMSMAATVAAPLERALGSIASLNSIYSSSGQGATEVYLRFDLDRDIHKAAREVQAAINAVRDQLPSGMAGNPTLLKVNPSQTPIIALALGSATRPPADLYNLAASILAQKLAQLPGVGLVRVDGASLPAVRVQLDAAALTARGLALEDVRLAIERANSWRPLGTVERQALRWQLQLSGPLRTAQAFSSLVIRPGRDVVRLGDVAQVFESVEQRHASGFHNDRPAVILEVSRRLGANIVETVDAIHTQLPRLRALLPADVDLQIVVDRSPGIRATLAEAQFSLMLSCLLVMGVVWLFLGTARTALIPALALPVSLIGTFAVMWWQGFSLNNLSLMALIVATGLVVDDAIVVLENTQRHGERQRRLDRQPGFDRQPPAEGQPPACGLRPSTRLSRVRAAMRGTGEVGFTLLAMNLALVVVFVAVLFSGGIVERLFREFSITLAAAILISLAVSVTLTPALCAHLLPLGPPRPGPLARLGGSLFDRLQRGYERGLDRALHHGALILLLLAGAIAVNVWLYVSISKSMLPEQDTGQLEAWIRGDGGFSFQVMQPKIEAYRRYLLADPAVADVSGTSGGRRGPSSAELRIRLKPLAERRESAMDVVHRLDAGAPRIAGASLAVYVSQDIRLDSRVSSGAQHFFPVRAESLSALEAWIRPLGEALEALPELTQVDYPRLQGARQVVIDIDREAAQRLGVRMEDVAALLNNGFSQRQVATLYDALNQYHVVMEIDPRQGSGPDALDPLHVVTRGGERVPLSAFSSWRFGLTSDQVYHDDQFVAMYVEYALAPGTTLQQAREAIDRAVVALRLPASILIKEQKGGGSGLNETLRRQPLLILGVVIAVYLVLGILYESTLHPLTVLSTLPPASLGALLALRLTGTEFSLIALLGLFLLIGVVMKNAILLIDFALTAQRRDGLTPIDAIRQAASLRLRPILMTNLAAILGALPLVLAMGEGAELRRPFGIAIIGGLALSQLLTLFTTPVIYLYVERWRAYASRLGRHSPEAGPRTA